MVLEIFSYPNLPERNVLTLGSVWGLLQYKCPIKLQHPVIELEHGMECWYIDSWQIHTFPIVDDVQMIHPTTLQYTTGKYTSSTVTCWLITKTCPCSIQRFYQEAKIEIFVGKCLIFLILLL